MRSQKSPCVPLNPNSFGNCVLVRCSATPALKPISTVSETKFTIVPALASQAANAIADTSSAVPAASAPNLVTSPAASSPSEEPTSNEMAVVTLMAV